jgi:hypothetical protein
MFSRKKNRAIVYINNMPLINIYEWLSNWIARVCVCGWREGGKRFKTYT